MKRTCSCGGCLQTTFSFYRAERIIVTTNTFSVFLFYVLTLYYKSHFTLVISPLFSLNFIMTAGVETLILRFERGAPYFLKNTRLQSPWISRFWLLFVPYAGSCVWLNCDDLDQECLVFSQLGPVPWENQSFATMWTVQNRTDRASALTTCPWWFKYLRYWKYPRYLNHLGQVVKVEA